MPTAPNLRLPITKVRDPIAVFRGKPGGAQRFKINGVAKDIGCGLAAFRERVSPGHRRAAVEIAIQRGPTLTGAGIARMIEAARPILRVTVMEIGRCARRWVAP